MKISHKFFGWVLVTIGIFVYMTLYNLYYTGILISSLLKNVKEAPNGILMLSVSLMIIGISIQSLFFWFYNQRNIAVTFIGVLIFFIGLYTLNGLITFSSYRNNIYDIPVIIYVIIGTSLIISGSIFIFKPRKKMEEKETFQSSETEVSKSFFQPY